MSSAGLPSILCQQAIFPGKLILLVQNIPLPSKWVSRVLLPACCAVRSSSGKHGLSRSQWESVFATCFLFSLLHHPENSQRVSCSPLKSSSKNQSLGSWHLRSSLCGLVEALTLYRLGGNPLSTFHGRENTQHSENSKEVVFLSALTYRLEVGDGLRGVTQYLSLECKCNCSYQLWSLGSHWKWRQKEKLQQTQTLPLCNIQAIRLLGQWEQWLVQILMKWIDWIHFGIMLMSYFS